MPKALTAITLIAAAAALPGCSMLGGKSAKTNTADEFAVARNAPLVVPPDFQLTPPVAGTAGFSPSDAQQQAIDALFGGPAPRSSIESTLLEKAGRGQAQLGIRSVAADGSTRLVDKGAATLAVVSAPVASSPIASAQPGQ